MPELPELPELSDSPKLSPAFGSWRAITWREWSAFRWSLTTRPHSRQLLIGPLCWNYCQPPESDLPLPPTQLSDEWADQCGALGCMCPCHRFGGDEYRRR